MIINKLDNDVFYDFASTQLGIDVRLYMHDLTLRKSENGVKLRVYLGGEIEDERKFHFKDGGCMYRNSALNSSIQDISYQWVQYLFDYADELTENERQEIVNIYNTNIENDINDYVSRKREHLISTCNQDIATL